MTETELHNGRIKSTGLATLLHCAQPIEWRTRPEYTAREPEAAAADAKCADPLRGLEAEGGRRPPRPSGGKRRLDMIGYLSEWGIRPLVRGIHNKMLQNGNEIHILSS